MEMVASAKRKIVFGEVNKKRTGAMLVVVNPVVRAPERGHTSPDHRANTISSSPIPSPRVPKWEPIDVISIEYELQPEDPDGTQHGGELTPSG